MTTSAVDATLRSRSPPPPFSPRELLSTSEEHPEAPDISKPPSLSQHSRRVAQSSHGYHGHGRGRRHRAPAPATGCLQAARPLFIVVWLGLCSLTFVLFSLDFSGEFRLDSPDEAWKSIEHDSHFHPNLNTETEVILYTLKMCGIVVFAIATSL